MPPRLARARVVGRGEPDAVVPLADSTGTAAAERSAPGGEALVDDPMNTDVPPNGDPEDEEEDLEPVEDEFDPFADRHVDAPPEEGEEGDDRVHAGS